jgi:hypothetical protein
MQNWGLPICVSPRSSGWSLGGSLQDPFIRWVPCVKQPTVLPAPSVQSIHSPNSLVPSPKQSPILQPIDHGLDLQPTGQQRKKPRFIARLQRIRIQGQLSSLTTLVGREKDVESSSHLVLQRSWCQPPLCRFQACVTPSASRHQP